MKISKRQIDWEKLKDDLLRNSAKYHRYFYKYDKFTGPSRHFHLRALKANRNEKEEMIYALLVSWGMHRMGGGAQMNEYKVFSKSISVHLGAIKKLKRKTVENIKENEFDRLAPIFKNLRIMKSKRKLVAFSKVFAHYLPGLIAPIDNEYTLRFVYQIPFKKALPLIKEEFLLFKDIHLNLFKPIISNKKFKIQCKKWIHEEKFSWDTSILKIVDNLIIGKMVHKKMLMKKSEQ